MMENPGQAVAEVISPDSSKNIWTEMLSKVAHLPTSLHAHIGLSSLCIIWKAQVSSKRLIEKYVRHFHLKMFKVAPILLNLRFRLYKSNTTQTWSLV